MQWVSTRAGSYSGACVPIPYGSLARHVLAAVGALWMAALTGAAAEPERVAAGPCRVEVVDRENGWPVPLVFLRTTHQLTYVTDNAGVVAIDTPELLGREVWFDVSGHGYTVPKDGFGYRGVRLTPERGKTVRVVVDRVNVAKRLGRLTGAGKWAESERAPGERDREGGQRARPAPGPEPVFGCDSVQLTEHRGRLFWSWGDTSVARYPLGVFDMTGATTPLRPLRTFQPPMDLAFELFRDEAGQARGIAKMPGAGPTWLGGYVSLPDARGVHRLGAAYIKVRNFLEAYESGLCVWDDERQRFERLRVVWSKSAESPKQPLSPEGHAVRWKEEGGREWVLFGNPFPTLRCPPTFEAWQDPARWERLDPQKVLVAASRKEGGGLAGGSAGGKEVRPHTGSIAWNAHRKRWVTVFMEAGGQPSAFGELWYAEADAPSGPWGPAVKVLSHDNYTFYNPRLHPELTPPDASFLLFEGTYTVQFADRPAPTPRYDYNQMLYRIDLDDPALAPAREPAGR